MNPISSSSSQLSQNTASRGGRGAKKKRRTSFTNYQVAVLEYAFSRSHFLSLDQDFDIAQHLNCNDKTVRTWFQNRRDSFRKNVTPPKLSHFHRSQRGPQYGDPPDYEMFLASVVTGVNTLSTYGRTVNPGVGVLPSLLASTRPEALLPTIYEH